STRNPPLTDNGRQYSCAYFEHPGQTLDDAQLAKKRHLAAKLVLKPGMRVLDIGCGWGGLALYLAQHGRARVTGIPLSQEQLALATGPAAANALPPPLPFPLPAYPHPPPPLHP